MKNWKLAVSSADSAPSTAPILLHGTVTENLFQAAELGYQAIEVHTRETAVLDYDGIREAEEKSGAKVCMVITGRLNTEGQCSLIDDRPYVAQAAMEGMKQYIDMASRLHADIVVGWVRGKIPAGGNRDLYLDRLAGNLKVLSEYGKSKNVKLNIEVINRYEVNIFTTAKETVDFIEKYKLENCYVHLDTFHMGIDEWDIQEAIRACKGRLGYVHLADNARFYPGSGYIDFKKVLDTLEEVGYEGYLSVECLPYPDRITAAAKAAAYVKAALTA